MHRAVLSPGFIRFWNAWPRHFRKTGRTQCAKKWERGNLEAQVDAILAGLDRCKRSPQWLKNAGEFIPMPMTWLNREGWEAPDESPPAIAVGGEWTPRNPTPQELSLIRDAGNEQ